MDAIAKIEIFINGEIEGEVSITVVYVYFREDFISKKKEDLIEKIRKILKKYSKITSVSIELEKKDNIADVYKKINGIRFNFHENILEKYDKDFRCYVFYKGFDTDNQTKKELFKEIENIYNDAQEIYIQELQKKLQEVV
jgi:hypothetical protein